MTSMFLAVAGLLFAIRGSYLGKKAVTDEDKNMSLMNSGAALILSGLALFLRG